jgi:hypothetical protein
MCPLLWLEASHVQMIIYVELLQLAKISFFLFKTSVDCDDVEEDEDFYDLAYCTANVAVAHGIGYVCAEEVLDDCRRAAAAAGTEFLGGATPKEFIKSKVVAAMSLNGSTFTKTLQLPGFMIQVYECDTAQCGTTPDGKKQGYMVSTGECEDFLEECDFSFSDDCVELVYCVEEALIDKTILLTDYECLEQACD